MLQQIMTQPGVIEFHDIPRPEAGFNQVLIKVAYLGICGSDIHVYHGKHPFTKYPVTQGHEVCGIVESVGKDVTGIKSGDKVTVEPQVVCQKCYPCRHNNYNLCEDLKVMGFQTTGAAAEYIAVDSAMVTLIPPDMDLKLGALIEPLAVGVHAVRKAGDVSGKNIVVMGAGPIGNLVAQAAKGLGAAKVLVADIGDYRLSLAADCGVDYTVNTQKENLIDKIIGYYGLDKADIIFDCAGNDASIGQAIQVARKGSFLVLVAVFDRKATVDLALFEDHELTLSSSMMYMHEDYVDAITLINEEKVCLEKIISKTFPFRQFSDAYEYIENNREISMKVIIDVQCSSI